MKLNGSQTALLVCCVACLTCGAIGLLAGWPVWSILTLFAIAVLDLAGFEAARRNRARDRPE